MALEKDTQSLPENHAGFLYLVSVFLRWTLILGLLFYSLTLVTALFEAHAFQRLVSQLISTPGSAVSEAQKQQVLLAVNGAADRLSSFKPKEDLFSQIAVRLDGLYGAVSGLRSVTGSFKFAIDEEGAIRAGERYRELLSQLDSSATSIADQLLTFRVQERKRLDSDEQKRKKLCSDEAKQKLEATVQEKEDALKAANAALEQAGAANQNVDDALEEAEKAMQARDAAIQEKKSNDELCVDLQPDRLALDVPSLNDFQTTVTEIASLEMALPRGTDDQGDENERATAQGTGTDPRLAEFNAAKKRLGEARSKFPGQYVESGEIDDFRKLLDEVQAAVDIMLETSGELERAGYRVMGGLSVSVPEDRPQDRAQPRSTAKLVPKGLENVGAPGSTWLRARDQTRDVTVPAIRYWLKETGDYRGTELQSDLYDAELAEAVDSFLRKKGLEADGEVFNGFRRAMNAHIDEEVKAGRYTFSIAEASPNTAPEAPANEGGPSSPEESFKSRMEMTLKRVKDALDNMRDTLVEGGTNMQEARAMSEPLSQIKAAALALDTLKIDPAGKPPEADRERTPEKVFQEESDRLRQAIAGIEKALESDLSPDFIIAQAIGEEVPNRHRAARAIWRAYVALGDFQPILTPFAPGETAKGGASDRDGDDSQKAGAAEAQGFWGKVGARIGGFLAHIKRFGLSAQRLATSSGNLLDLMVIFVVGAIGSLIYITKYQLNLAIKGKSLSNTAARSWAWYVFRPVFGIVVAFALYLLYKAGQIALGAGVTQQVSTEVNLPILSILALFSGLLAWQTLNVIESKGQAWLAGYQRRNLWATGLENAAAAAEVTLTDLARHVGVSDIQVERWLACIDKVTPEMQDRICTYLDKRREEVFGDVKIENLPNQGPKLATGLAAVMATRQLDDAALAELMDEPVDRIRAWREQEVKVSPVVQLRLAEKLRCSQRELFGVGDASSGRWGVGLRSLLERKSITSERAAEALQEPVERVRDWIELVVPIPPECEKVFQEKLQPEFDPFDDERHDKGMWAVGLRQALKEKDKTADDLAQYLDTSAKRVNDWIDMNDSRGAGRVARPTRERIARYLERVVEDPDLFSEHRTNTDFRD